VVAGRIVGQGGYRGRHQGAGSRVGEVVLANAMQISLTPPLPSFKGSTDAQLPVTRGE
jgi:hypothetical protein